MKLLGLALIMVSSSAFAAITGYDLKMDLSINGKHISSPRLIVNTGEMGTIIQKTDTEETFIQVVATESDVQNHKDIMMKFTVGYIGNNGERTIVSKPEILAKENEAALITVREKTETELSLSVVAKRKHL